MKNKMQRALLQAALTNVDLTTITRVAQAQPGLFNSTPIAFQRQLLQQRERQQATAANAMQQQAEEDEEEEETEERDEVTENLVTAAAEAEYNANNDLTVEREEIVDENNNNVIQVDENNNEIIIRGTVDAAVDQYEDENNNNNQPIVYTQSHNINIGLSETQENLLQQIDDLVEQQLQVKSSPQQQPTATSLPLDLTSSAAAVLLNSFEHEPRFD